MTGRQRRYGIATSPKDRRADRHRARRHDKLVRSCAECGELILRSGPGRPPATAPIAAGWQPGAADRLKTVLSTQPAATTMQNGGEATHHNSALTAR